MNNIRSNIRSGHTATNTAAQNASHRSPVGAAASVIRASCKRRDEGGKLKLRGFLFGTRVW